MRWPANSSPSCRVGTEPLYSKVPTLRRVPWGPPAPISSAASMRGPSAIRAAAWGAVVLGRGRAVRPPPPSPPAARGHRRRRRGAARAARGHAPLEAARRRGRGPADARLRGDLPDAQRRSRAPARAGARALPRGRRPRHRPGRAARPAHAARLRAPGGRAAAGRRAGARLVPLAVVLRPARDGRLSARPAGRPAGQRRGADLRGLRPRAHRLLGGAHRAAVVRGRAGRAGARASRACAA